MKVDGIELGPVLISDPGFVLDLTYQPYNARPARRLVDVQSLHGRGMDCPTYLRGYDSLTRMVLTFRIDRIQALHLLTGDRTLNVDWFIGQLARAALGQPQHIEPRVFSLARPIMLGVQWGSNPVKWHDGETIGAAFGYRDAGHVIVISYVADNDEHQAEFGEGARGWRIVDWWDGTTGEVVDDHLGWLDGGPATYGV